MLLPLLLALAAAPENTGLDLVRMCNADPGTPVHAMCALYLAGLRDGVKASADFHQQFHRPLACIPPLVTTEDLRAAMRQGIKGNTSRLQAPMNAAAVGVVVEKYPCRSVSGRNP